MNYDIRTALKSYHNVRMMIEGIHRELWRIFLPETINGLVSLEMNIIAFKKKAIERDKVMSIQREYGIPLRPNEPLDEVTARARSQGTRWKRPRKRRDEDDRNSE